MTLSCGCEQDGSARCPEHTHWPCHDPVLSKAIQLDADFLRCPPCRIAKWRSVSLSSAATPTRKP